MLYQIIFTYLVTVILVVNLNVDIAFIFFSLTLFLIVKYFAQIYKRHFKNIKDMSINMSFIPTIIVFALSICTVFYVESNITPVSHSLSTSELRRIAGKAQSTHSIGETTFVTLMVSSIHDVGTDKAVVNNLDYVDIKVSPYSRIQVGDSLEIIGEVKLRKYKTFTKYNPFIFTYEQEKVGSYSRYEVSYPKQITTKVTQAEDESKIEKYLLQLRLFSETLKTRLTQHMREPYAQVASGISLGQQDTLSKEIKDIFRTSGLIHILVLSGANISFIISIIWFLLRNQHRIIKTSMSIFLSWLFIFTTGLTAPSIRAGTMASTTILAEFFSRKIETQQSLLLSLFILTMASPLLLINSASLHLSFLACVGVFIVSHIIENIFTEKSIFTFIFCITISIWLTTTPYILAMTDSSSIFGTLLTLLVEPLVALVTIISFLIIISSFVSLFVANILGIVNTILVKIILSVASFGAEAFPVLSFHISKTNLITFYMLLGILIYKVQKNDRIKKNKISI